MGSVEHRHIKHGDDKHVHDRLAAEAAQFKDTRTVGQTTHTQSAAPSVAGEHVHHHVHENIQPVIQKETVQPSVVHTTVPVHEVHQNEAKHHTATSLPAVTMDEFKRAGGSLTGREERTDAFGGEPRSVGGTLGGEGAKGTTSLTEGSHSGHHHGTHGTHGTHSNTTGTTGTSGLRSGNSDTTQSGVGSTGLGSHSTNSGVAGTGVGSHTGSHNTTGSGLNSSTANSAYNDTTGTAKKASLIDKLNPTKDTTGDGKAGFMK